MKRNTLTLTLLICALLHTVFATPAPAQDQSDDPNDRVQYNEDGENKHVDDQPAPPKHESATSILRSAASDTSSILSDLPKEERKFELFEIIKIRISESTAANDKVTMRSERGLDINATIGEYFQLTGKTDGVLPKFVESNGVEPEFDLETSLERDNRGSLKKTSSFTAVIAAQIVDIKPNGTLVVTAEKSIVINEETQKLRLTGIISQDDIDITNFINSADIVDLRLEYLGDGPVSDLTKRGFIGRVIDAIWPFK